MSSPRVPHIVRVFEAVDDACALMRAGCPDCVSFLDDGRRVSRPEFREHGMSSLILNRRFLPYDPPLVHAVRHYEMEPSPSPGRNGGWQLQVLFRDPSGNPSVV